MYNGMIKGSRSLDLAALSAMLDAASLAFLAYSPEQLGIAIPVYAAIRIVVTVLQVYVRFKTTGPVGAK
jgi:hypothetical protein